MTNQQVINDYNLDAMTTHWAVEIFEQTKDEDEALDLAHQYADRSEWVIYYYKAHQLCAACNTDNGEDVVSECGEPEGGWTYDGFARAIAYGEIVGRLQSALHVLYEMADQLEEC